MISRHNAAPLLAGLLACGLPFPAQAHLVGVELGGFYAGLLHVVSAVDYIALLCGLIIFAALQHRSITSAAVLGLIAGLGLGTLTGTSLPELGQQIWLLTAILCLGALSASAVKLRYGIVLVVAAVLSVPLGLSNGAATHEGPVDINLFVAGVVIGGGACCVIGCASLAVLVDRIPLGALALRTLGGWLVAFGLIGVGVALQGQVLPS